MPFTTWIRDLFGIRKDVIDTKKAKLEITKLEDEEDERRGLIDLATLDDVKKYDPKYGQIEKQIASQPEHLEYFHDVIGMRLAAVALWLAVLGLLVLLARLLWKALHHFW
jgi:hypothetical protein